MTSRDFCYWLQGYFEIHHAGLEKVQVNIGLTHERVQVIRNHLAMVFKHEIDPSMGDKQHQQDLQHLHQGYNNPTIDSTLFKC